jgi:hypothetical protein
MYSAMGRKYIEEAMDAARSSLRFNDLPHLLFADEEVADPPPGLAVVRFDPVSEYPWVDRIANMRRSPFERTLYLDSDAVVVGEIGHVFEVLDNYDVAAAFSPGHRGLDDPAVPVAFCEFNCGVIAWRTSERTADFLRDWEATHRAWIEEDVLPGAPGNPTNPSLSWPGDQPAFRRCAWQHGMAVYVLPHEYNLRIGLTSTVVGPVRIIHGRFGDHDLLAAKMNKKLVPRTYPTPQPLRQFRRKAVNRMLRELRPGRRAS